ncbi:hypothetical protein ABPG75_011172 [Micractinium tetrahymenae]
MRMGPHAGQPDKGAPGEDAELRACHNLLMAAAWWNKNIAELIKDLEGRDLVKEPLSLAIPMTVAGTLGQFVLGQVPRISAKIEQEGHPAAAELAEALMSQVASAAFAFTTSDVYAELAEPGIAQGVAGMHHLAQTLQALVPDAELVCKACGMRDFARMLGQAAAGIAPALQPRDPSLLAIMARMGRFGDLLRSVQDLLAALRLSRELLGPGPMNALANSLDVLVQLIASAMPKAMRFDEPAQAAYVDICAKVQVDVVPSCANVLFYLRTCRMVAAEACPPMDRASNALNSLAGMLARLLSKAKKEAPSGVPSTTSIATAGSPVEVYHLAEKLWQKALVENDPAAQGVLVGEWLPRSE